MAGTGGHAEQATNAAAILDNEQSASIERVRKRLTRAIPGIISSLLKEARKGSLPHIKLLLQLAGLEQGGLASRAARPQERTLEEILMEQWAKEP